jgi:hypothetical protein
MSKILTCTVCGKRFISEEVVSTCEVCLSKSVKNDDPIHVAPINIMKMVSSFEKQTDKRIIVNSLRELDFVLNRAFLAGYITLEFYSDVCEEVGLTPVQDDYVNLTEDDYYDYSINARIGFYQDMFEESED